ncbi:MAG: hypothetical protein A2132_05010 [Nitrospirae bacterium RBG_16_43_11]|nr:MAG: hypothetical protein A2132_05010 [Nitrospirae bacterium RBG_16_43_11]
MSNSESSYLFGDQWILELSIRKVNPDNRNTWYLEKTEIPASYDTTDIWNARFWSMFPKDELGLLYCVEDSNGIVISTSFPFRPTVSLKERYGNFSLAKIRRIAANWHSSKGEPPHADLQKIIDTFEHDQLRYDEQYSIAWSEFVQRRLPRPLSPFYWYHYVGGIILGDVFFFRLWHPKLGYEPQQE